MGALLRADDPLARRDSLELADLADRRWFRFPEGTDRAWNAGDTNPLIRSFVRIALAAYRG